MILQAGNNHLLYEVDEATGKLVEIVCEECSVRKRVVDLTDGTVSLWVKIWVRGIPKFFKLSRSKLYNGDQLWKVNR